MKELINKNSLSTEPLFNSWSGKVDAGSWGLDFDFDFDPQSPSLQDINKWYFDCLKGSLEAFSYLARIWKVGITLADQSQIAGETLEWKPDKGEKYEQYVTNVLDKLQNYPYEIYEIKARLDLYVFVDTKESLNKPVKSWIRDITEAIY